MMKILVVTVGGSLAPIRSEWQALQPDLTYFVCSCDDPVAGTAGSCKDVTGPSKSSLVNEFGLQDDAFRVVEVEPDDLVGAWLRLSDVLANIRTEYPEASVYADYTGGTKSMTAALVLASADKDFLQLRVVTGSRGNLVKVVDGTQSPQPVDIGPIRARRDFEVAAAHWQSYNYESTVRALNALLPDFPASPLRNQATFVRTVSQAFGSWDRFAYVQALSCLDVFDHHMSPALREYHIALKDLSRKTNKEPKLTLLYLWDLWLNINRRAEQGRFDDAVVRSYRLLEASGQWILSFHGINTARVDVDSLPEGLQTELAIRSEVVKPVSIGLFSTWIVVHHFDQGVLATEMRSQTSTWRSLIETRNRAFLGHGFEPITKEEWAQWLSWLQSRFIPALKQEAMDRGIRRFPDQLPRSITEILASQPS